MTRFSANLGFLWNDRPLPEAIRAAHAAGFAAVECHWPYATPAEEVRATLEATGLPMLGLNTLRGKPGENGLAALPGREAEARAAIDQAIDYANATDTGAIHVMAGFAQGEEARHCFEANLAYAAERTERMILIEPLNRHDAPGYFLQTTDQAREIIGTVDAPNLKLMFDCYHVGRTEGDVMTRLSDLLSVIGHIQFAAVPDRGVPDHGELNYAEIFAHIATLGWDTPLGAEFKPAAPEDITGWIASVT
ncbi:TIM barrel protein [uncultured Roseobacter sp.]|uniref:hydroxypyruvate isomerase family protein n=1 Tax=uncultured Roseobacter sp. TaxID=114847 RepID=UPI0026394893|nr:TIM barrel protein [uncultured Roseobacter sp.]